MDGELSDIQDHVAGREAMRIAIKTRTRSPDRNKIRGNSRDPVKLLRLFCRKSKVMTVAVYARN